VVTGGSDGIGLAMCHQMAARNFNICIIGRNEAKMQEKIEELKLKYPKVKYMYLVVDFSKLNSLEEYQQLVGDKLKDVDVAMLILNAGLASMGRFAQLTGETVQSVINVNALHPLYTTKVLLNQMLARKKRSGIIVVGSVAGSRAMAGQLCYSATKSFASIMGQCLHYECKDKIDVISWEPGYVATKLSKMRPSMLCLPVLNAVQGILKDVGRDSISGGDATHECTRSGLQLLPDSILQPKMLKSADHVFKR
jgi:short-subunit dehydrogenase